VPVVLYSGGLKRILTMFLIAKGIATGWWRDERLQVRDAGRD